MNDRGVSAESRVAAESSGIALPPDARERSRALDPSKSFLVQAPAGSGKTYLLTQRFLRLLAEVESPDQIVAITFTRPAAAEMRNRLLEALETAAHASHQVDDPESLTALALRALQRSEQLGWRLLEQSAQLRILTIDAFCRSLALQSPLSWGVLSGLGGKLEMADDAEQLYRLAAGRTVAAIGREDAPVRASVEALLRRRDNNWNDVEGLIAEMLQARSRWFQDFVLTREINWEALRIRLEGPFRRGARQSLRRLSRLLDDVPQCRERALALARFACETPGDSSPSYLAELAELPEFSADEEVADEVLESAAADFRCLAEFLTTQKGWRSARGLTTSNGFPLTDQGRFQKASLGKLVEELKGVPGALQLLVELRGGLPVRYSDEEWEEVRHCFAVLREAWAQLQAVFAETGTADYTEVAQLALRILEPENGYPSDLAMRQADGVRHLLVDEFQDTSRPQYELLARLIGAWPEREGRSCFCVGDPMQSIYGFRDAEVELFERMKRFGLPAGRDAGDEPFRFEFVQLRANFRTTPSLVNDLNERFAQIFAAMGESGVPFSPAEAVRPSTSQARLQLHLAFARRGGSDSDAAAGIAEPGHPVETARTQLAEMVTLIRSKLEEASQRGGQRFRIAVLARKRKSLTPIAEALREGGIPFRSVDVVPLRQRPEVLDALALARALLHPADRTAWLGVLRAPWCGLSLTELHLLTAADDGVVMTAPVPELLAKRLPLLAAEGRLPARAIEAATRVEMVCRHAMAARSSAGSLALGTWLESVWLALGGADTVTPEHAENLRVLWAALDALPGGELDLCGPGLGTALSKLHAQPDPAASSDFGVQLMTIHKSKGLEFELVIVPELQARESSRRGEMIVWLERGLAETTSGEEHASEFLVAPIQAKGSQAGEAKTWVTKAKQELERQEAKRLLYVAATRAREELHLFAEPRFRVDRKTGERALSKAQGLLWTAWPAIGDEVSARFAEWCKGIPSTAGKPGNQVISIAAEAGSTTGSGAVIPFPAIQQPLRPTGMRRLPSGYAAPGLKTAGHPGRGVGLTGSTGLMTGPTRQPGSPDYADEAAATASRPLYARAEGGPASRAVGSAIHFLLEQLSRLRATMGPAEAADAVASHLPGILADLRSLGMTRAEAQRLAKDALDTARQSSLHPVGAWILSPHAESLSEARWTGTTGHPTAAAGRQIRDLRADRVFAAPGPPPLAHASSDEPTESGSEPVWWIVDYKTMHPEGVDLRLADERLAFLDAHRRRHAEQLELYARLLRQLQDARGETRSRIRVGLFYPRAGLFDFWEV